MPRIPSTYVPLGEAVIKVACAWFSEEISKVGLTTDEAASLFRWSLARAKAAAGTQYVSRNAPPRKGIAVKLTQEDRQAAVQTPEITALLERAAGMSNIPKEAYTQLRDLLSAGDLTGFIFDESSGRPHKIGPHRWNNEDADTAHERGQMRAINGYGYITGPAAILRADLENVLAGGSAQAPEPATAASQIERSADTEPRNRRGPPKQYDEVELLIQAARLIYEGFIPGHQTDLRKAALDAYQEVTGQTPSEEWAKPIIRRFWNGLELERQDKKRV